MSFFMPGKFHPGMRSSFPRRRKFSRQNRFRRRRRFSRFSRQMVRSTIVRDLQPEVKFLTDIDEITNIDEAKANVIQDFLSSVAQGPGPKQRIGRKIQPISFLLRYHFTGQGDPGNYVAACTVAVVQFKSSIDAGATVSEQNYFILEVDPLTALVQHVNKQFKTLGRKTFVISDLRKSNGTNSSGFQQFLIKRHQLLPITYSGPLLTDVDTGRFVIFLISSVPAAQASGITFNYSLKMSYIDI